MYFRHRHPESRPSRHSERSEESVRSQRSFVASLLRMTDRLRRTKNDGGFTFIEILMTLTVIAVLFVPVMQLFSNALFSTSVNLESITAMNLAQSEMERTINLNLTKAQLQKIGTQTFPPEDEKPTEMNHQFWRVKRELVQDSDPLEVRVSVYKDEEPGKSLVTLTTLVEDLMWGSVQPVGTA